MAIRRKCKDVITVAIDRVTWCRCAAFTVPVGMGETQSK